MDRILIATDGSPSAQEAVDFGLELAADQAATATFVHVVPAVDVVPRGGFGFTGAVPHELTRRDTELAGRGPGTGRGGRRDRPHEAVARRPGRRDRRVRRHRRCRRDRRRVARPWRRRQRAAGSVSRAILREARRPVLVVRGAAARRSRSRRLAENPQREPGSAAPRSRLATDGGERGSARLGEEQGRRHRRRPRRKERTMTRKFFEIGGIVAAAVLIAFGIAAIVMSVNGPRRSATASSRSRSRARPT